MFCFLLAVGFTSRTYEVIEHEGEVGYCVEVLGGTLEGMIQVRVRIQDGTAESE